MKGKSFRRVLWFYMLGLDPESAFREMAKVEFDGARATPAGRKALKSLS